MLNKILRHFFLTLTLTHIYDILKLDLAYNTKLSKAQV
jgi:hypothetical protein